MKRFALLLSALFITLILAGCGSSGKNFPAVHIPEIKNGVTSQAQIRDWFGIPFKEGMRDGGAMWTYQFDTYSVFSSSKSKELVILFGLDNIVKGYRYASNID